MLCSLPNRPLLPRRRAFTLVEMLIVISIIAILLALSAAAAMRYIAVGTTMNAEATLKKLDSGLMQQWRAVIDSAQQEYRAGQNLPSNLSTAAGNNPTVAQQLYVMLRLEQEFPVTYSEAQNSVSITYNNTTVTLSAKPTYQKALQGAVGGGSEESSACLYVALRQARRGMVFNAEEAVGVNSIRLQNDQNVPPKQWNCFVDVWGNPLRFTRNDNPANLTQQPEIISVGPDNTFGTGDDISSVRLRQTGSRGD